MFVFHSEDYGGAFKLLDSCCFLISYVIYLCPKLLIARRNQGNTAWGSARIMVAYFMFLPQKEMELGMCLSLFPVFVSFVCFTGKQTLVCCRKHTKSQCVIWRHVLCCCFQLKLRYNFKYMVRDEIQCEMQFPDPALIIGKRISHRES